MRRLLRQLGLAALAAVLVQPVGAHAFLERAVPAVGSSVHTSPAELKLWFTQRLEPAFSKVPCSMAAASRSTAATESRRHRRRTARVSLPRLRRGLIE
jgi:methionine-rich copper-binding protein CopC